MKKQRRGQWPEGQWKSVAGDLESHDELQSEDGDSNELSSEDREVLRKLNSALLLPVMAKDGLLGVISVGAHLGDLPFSNDDKRLVLSVGAPASFALENIQLIERTIEDARRRQDLEAEYSASGEPR